MFQMFSIFEYNDCVLPYPLAQNIFPATYFALKSSFNIFIEKESSNKRIKQNSNQRDLIELKYNHNLKASL